MVNSSYNKCILQAGRGVRRTWRVHSETGDFPRKHNPLSLSLSLCASIIILIVFIPLDICVADDLRLFGVTGDWKTAALDPGAWYNTVQEGGCRFMAAWVREDENASNQRQKKRDAEEADKVEVAPGVTVASLRRFRTALIGPTQGLPKRRRLCR